MSFLFLLTATCRMNVQYHLALGKRTVMLGPLKPGAMGIIHGVYIDYLQNAQGALVTES